VCQYLIAEQCPYDTDACAAAATAGRLETVHFLRESGLHWDADTICCNAARSSNRELLQYLKQQECIFGASVMSIAAARGDTQMCQYLRSEQCPWETRACGNAARGGHLDTLRWLHEQGCPWEIQADRVTAVVLGLPLVIFQYMLDAEPAASAAQLTELLRRAGMFKRQPIAEMLRQYGAEWPAELRCYGNECWHADMVQWARDEGCTSPV
jgi:hypothetical protein